MKTHLPYLSAALLCSSTLALRATAVAIEMSWYYYSWTVPTYQPAPYPTEAPHNDPCVPVTMTYEYEMLTIPSMTLMSSSEIYNLAPGESLKEVYYEDQYSPVAIADKVEWICRPDLGGYVISDITQVFDYYQSGYSGVSGYEIIPEPSGCVAAFATLLLGFGVWSSRKKLVGDLEILPTTEANELPIG